MAKRAYVPERGDIVWIQLSPQAGHEQAGHRPALVLSPVKYNRRTGLMLCCPMTTKIKGYPFEVLVEDKKTQSGAILADQVKSLDWRARRAKKKGRVSNEVIQETLGKLHALLL